MDISDINKVANRKRMNTDAVKLREKVSQETAKIIKLKVAQDTAYWDLKEKLQQLEGNHERLQQNMVEVQMQHEAISGQYQEELRLRPDTLNKLAGTRDICDVLEEYGDRLRRTVARCRADQQALGAAYGACGARVRRLAADAARARDLAHTRASDSRAALERHDADARRLTLSAEQLGATRARCDLLEEVRRELVERLDQYSAELRRREEGAVLLQADVARLQRELEAKNAELTRAVNAHELELQTSRSRAEQVDAALRDSERQATSLQRLLGDAQDAFDSLSIQYQEASTTVELLNKELASSNKGKKELEKMLNDREQQVTTVETELVNTKNRLSTLEAERLEIIKRLEEALQRGQRENGRAEEMARRVHALEIDITKIQEAHADHQAEMTRLVEELRLTLAERERELDVKTDTITRLMSDLKGEAEARNRSEAALSATRQQHDAERTAGDTARADLSATIQRLETTIRAKDDEITTQKNVILEVRSEKERLQERIRAMQSTISNIQQELTGRPTPMAPAAERERDAMVFSYMSDGSMDSDALDALEVSRRFDALARGERATAPLRAPRSHASKKSLSQAKKDSKLQSRRFFKSKLEGKVNKLKE